MTPPPTFILNCEPSAGADGDWIFEDAVAAGVVAAEHGRVEPSSPAHAKSLRSRSAGHLQVVAVVGDQKSWPPVCSGSSGATRAVAGDARNKPRFYEYMGPSPSCRFTVNS